MAYTQTEIDYIIGPALDRLAAKQVTFATQTTVQALAVLRHYDQTRDSLLRSYVWPFAKTQAELYQVSTLLLDSSPTSAWSVGDTITGITSGVTAEILTVTSSTEYVIIYKTGDFTDGETITNATVEQVYWEGIEVLNGTEEVYWWDGSSASQVVCGAAYPTATAVTPNHKWTYKYYLPDDFLRLLSIDEIDDTDYVDKRFERQGRYIFTDKETLNIDYVQKKTDPSVYEDLFIELFILQLAVKLVNPLAGSASQRFKDELRQDLKDAKSRARLVASVENNVQGRNDWDNARFGVGV